MLKKKQPIILLKFVGCLSIGMNGVYFSPVSCLDILHTLTVVSQRTIFFILKNCLSYGERPIVYAQCIRPKWIDKYLMN